MEREREKRRTSASEMEKQKVRKIEQDLTVSSSE